MPLSQPDPWAAAVLVDEFNARCLKGLVGIAGEDDLDAPDLLPPEQPVAKLLDKALSECEIRQVGLYNWTEPLLHPNLPVLVREIKSRNLA